MKVAFSRFNKGLRWRFEKVLSMEILIAGGIFAIIFSIQCVLSIGVEG